MKCPDCGCEMKWIAESWVDEYGHRYVSYKCPCCGLIIKVQE